MPFKEYVAELQRNLKSGNATEPTYYPALKSLLESLDSSISVLQNPKKTEHGSPDFRLTRKRTIEFPVGWIEAKLPGEDLDRIARSDQLKRYYHLPNLILTDFLEFRWYTDGKPRLTASLGVLADGKCKFDTDGQTEVEELLRGFLAHKTPPAKDSRDLARRMAQLAHFIRDAILIALEREAETGILHQQMDAFREALIPDLDAEQFADMYSQTIAYGLFAARCQPPQPGEKFTRERAAYLIPKTNPFLRKLFSVIAGPDLPEQILPYMDDLVALLRDTDIGAIMADFGKRTAKEDPVVHFYEDFLQAYDPKLRELRGVYYTPEPVVSYIVRSIDYILKTQFSKPLGLADKDVLILDPACGTGTFLYYVIRHIYDTLCRHGQKGQWNSYVSEHLLKRIFGFELLMAPYAVAHLKLGLLLQELGYKFESDERLGVYLTNTLEEAAKKSELFFGQWIADESNAASEIKRDKPIMVVLGNPPYSNFGRMNRGKWILDLLKDYKKGLRERKHNLNDDFIKFIRFAQWRLDRTGFGVLGFISNNTYVDGLTHRKMRQSLAHSFDRITIMNLHGDKRKKEPSPDGTEDQNVFDIMQGVAIGIFSKTKIQNERKVLYQDLWGERNSKYDFLASNDISTGDWSEQPLQAPSWYFCPEPEFHTPEYDEYWKLTDILKGVCGIETKRDHFAMDFDRDVLGARIREFVDDSTPTSEKKEKFDLRDNEWSVEEAIAKMKGDVDWPKSFFQCLYRPFDLRWIIYSDTILARSRGALMAAMTLPNLGIVAARQSKEPFAALACNSLMTHKIVTVYDRSYLFPLYSYGRGPASAGLFKDGARRHNVSPLFISALTKTLRLEWRDYSSADLAKWVGPEDVISYIYSVFHSGTYRGRYSDALKKDFPRVPLTSDKKLFANLAEKGGELISLHLMESAKLSQFITKYEQSGEHEVKKVFYAEPNPKAGIKSGRVYVNDAQYFEGVPKEVWEFHIGGYQVCEKWLKDRKGRKLSSDDIDHYQKIVVALSETIRIMAEIDSIIPAWPLP